MTDSKVVVGRGGALEVPKRGLLKCNAVADLATTLGYVYTNID